MESRLCCNFVNLSGVGLNLNDARFFFIYVVFFVVISDAFTAKFSVVISVTQVLTLDNEVKPFRK